MVYLLEQVRQITSFKCPCTQQTNAGDEGWGHHCISHPLMATSSRLPYHKVRIISNWFLEHDNEFTVLKWPPQSPDLIFGMWWNGSFVHPTNLHQLQDAMLSKLANISKECFQHLIESMLRRIKAGLKAKGGQTQY